MQRRQLVSRLKRRTDDYETNPFVCGVSFIRQLVVQRYHRGIEVTPLFRITQPWTGMATVALLR
jgi:hypothetical protein